jgi:y4mF family transcriptional regulator
MKTVLTLEILGSIIKKRRKEQRLTQEQLAVFSGVGLRFLREVEQGKDSAHIGKVLQIVEMLGLILKVEEK